MNISTYYYIFLSIMDANVFVYGLLRFCVRSFSARKSGLI